MASDIHLGHRNRITNRLLTAPESLTEHELLEIALFLAIPRKNTNDVAHLLLAEFGNIQGVFEAPNEKLLQIDGVGENVVRNIKIIKLLCENMGYIREGKTVFNFSSPALALPLLRKRVETLNSESVLLILLDENSDEISALLYNDNQKDSVTAGLADLTYSFGRDKPKKLLIAHNHPSNNTNPSLVDDISTKRIAEACSNYGVKLIDHIIFSKDSFYSYHTERRLEFIKMAKESEITKFRKENENNGES